MLEVNHLAFGYGRDTILRDISFQAYPGQITAVIGPNGVGKSTILKCIAGLEKGTGDICFCGKNRKEMNAEEISRTVSYLNQNSACEAQLNVYEVILLGLLNDLKFKVQEEDMRRVEEVIDLLSLHPYAHRKISELSGGQQQLVFIAQTLIKNPRILMMDEPTSALDLNKQFQLMELLQKITKENNLTSLVTLHHLDITAKYADRVIVVHDGSVYRNDDAEAVFTPEMLREVYCVNAEVYTDTMGGKHIIAIDRV